MSLKMRIGHGFDVHAFTEGDSIILGGVRIAHQRAFKAHSDGDVLIHALCAALLGALALGDIGQHFPDTDGQWKNADSILFLSKVADLMAEQGYTLANADMTIVAQAPKLAGYTTPMIKKLSKVLLCEPGCLNIKATTTEKLGYCGREEGIAVHAVVLLEQVA